MRVMDFGNIPHSKPLYALVGANSALITRLRELPADLSRVQEDVQAQIRDVPAQVARYAGEIGDRVTLIYTELADRGQRLVGEQRTAEPPPAG